jgi:hypothetical protein
MSLGYGHTVVVKTEGDLLHSAHEVAPRALESFFQTEQNFKSGIGSAARRCKYDRSI